MTPYLQLYSCQLAFNRLLKLAESLNSPRGYQIQLPIEGTNNFLLVDSYAYVKWSGSACK